MDKSVMPLDSSFPYSVCICGTGLRQPSKESGFSNERKRFLVLVLYGKALPPLRIVLHTVYRRNVSVESSNKERFVARSVLHTTNSSKSVNYFPWGDGVDYDRLCRVLVKRLNTSSSGYTIIHNANRGGLGHMHKSILSSITYALLLGRRFRLYMDPVYWNNLNSCFRELRYDGPIKAIEGCGYYRSCLTTKHNIYSMKKTNLVVTDFREGIPKQGRQRILQTLHAIGFLKSDEGYKEFYRYAVRILLNPSSEVISIIQKEREAVGLPQYQVGVHVRCGGTLSDVPEAVAMVTPAILESIPDRIRQLIQDSSIPHEHVFVFLATDSSAAAKRLSRRLAPIQVKTVDVYSRGHTDSRIIREDGLRRTLIEVFLMAQSRTLLLSSNSGFSGLINWMGVPERVQRIRAPYVLLEGVKSPFTRRAA